MVGRVEAGRSERMARGRPSDIGRDGVANWWRGANTRGLVGSGKVLVCSRRQAAMCHRSGAGPRKGFSKGQFTSRLGEVCAFPFPETDPEDVAWLCSASEKGSV